MSAASAAPSGAPSCGAVLAEATRRLEAAGVPDARRDARVLLAALLEVDMGVLLCEPDRRLSAGEAARFDAMIRAREARQPVSRILGTRAFWSLSFALDPATLDPRPDSEAVIESVLARRPDRAAPWRILDLGTGSGCLLLALLSEYPNAGGIGVDREPAAAATAARNAQALGFSDRSRMIVGDWACPLDGYFDILVSNPPYLRHDEIAQAAPEVAQWDPHGALDGGEDGLAAYRALLPQAHKRVAPGGLIVLEVGIEQAEPVAALAAQAGLTVLDHGYDLAGIARCVIAERPTYTRPTHTAVRAD